MTAQAASEHSWFKRILLPGLALKAFVIGGGYATGRELAEFFLPAGPRGGLMAIGLATVIMSFLSVITFMLARRIQAFDYRTFFKSLLGFPQSHLHKIFVAERIYHSRKNNIYKPFKLKTTVIKKKKPHDYNILRLIKPIYINY